MSSRQEALTLIAGGLVLVNGAVADKAARQVHPGDALRVVEAVRYVGRGAHKLAAALDAFGIDPTGTRCLDVGASTGGFTDVLLQRGAAGVVALDVGFGQLHERIRADERVAVVERTNMRHVATGDLGEAFSLVVVDVSFISLQALMTSLSAQLADDGDLVVLVKPQFEVGRQQASKSRGVITDPDLWREAIDGVVAAASTEGLSLTAMIRSPITGADGNVEFLARLQPGGDAVVSEPSDLVDAVVQEPSAVTPGDLR